MMDNENAMRTLVGMIDQAKARDSAGDVVMRDQMMRNMEDLPLPTEVIRSAQSNAELLPK
jgi:hypothetical protein